jgi:hypothetical protein
MSARSLFHKFVVIVSIGNIIHGIAHAEDAHSDYLAQYRNQPEIHGLYEIREAARNFLNKENAKKKHKFRVLGPDIRIQVPRCVVPLTAKWAHETLHYNPPGMKSISFNQPGIDVICKKSIDKNDHSWDVFVPITSPQVEEEGRRLREELERKATAAK